MTDSDVASILSGLLLIVVVIGSIIWEYKKNQHILQYGDLVEGLITEHHRHSGSSGTFYSLTYTYEYGGKTYSKKQSVSKETYLDIPDGTRISVRCLPNNPQRARIDERKGFMLPSQPDTHH